MLYIYTVLRFFVSETNKGENSSFGGLSLFSQRPFRLEESERRAERGNLRRKTVDKVKFDREWRRSRTLNFCLGWVWAFTLGYWRLSHSCFSDNLAYFVETVDAVSTVLQLGALPIHTLLLIVLSILCHWLLEYSLGSSGCAGQIKLRKV